MEWAYHITHSFTYQQGTPSWTQSRPPLELSFNPGEIDEPLYTFLAKVRPDAVTRVPKNPLVAAIYAARGLT